MPLIRPIELAAIIPREEKVISDNLRLNSLKTLSLFSELKHAVQPLADSARRASFLSLRVSVRFSPLAH